MLTSLDTTKGLQNVFAPCAPTPKALLKLSPPKKLEKVNKICLRLSQCVEAWFVAETK